MQQIHDAGTRDWGRSLCRLLVGVLSLALVLALTADAWARSSGGRYGGRSGFSQSRNGMTRDGGVSQRSAPTTPYDPSPPRTYIPPVSTPGFGYFPFFLPFLGWGGGMGGGFGLGGILSLLLILGIVVVVGKVLLQNLATARRYRPGHTLEGRSGGDRYVLVRCQVALFSTAHSLQRELREQANAAITDTPAGLVTALQDLVVALTRSREYWRYGTVQVQRMGSMEETERAFNLAVAQERAKLSEELTVNVDGARRHASMQQSAPTAEVGRYLVVTLIVATAYPDFAAYTTPSLQELEGTVQRLGTLLTSDLLALEVIWSPENPDDSLTEDELLTEYPELSGL